LTQAATVHVGYEFNEETHSLHDKNIPVKDLLPMVDPCDFEITGWDISGLNLYESCKRARVLEPDLISQLKQDLEKITPMPAAFMGDFIASNQADRADNIIKGSNQEIINKLRQDIRKMKEKCDTVVILWTANTEQYLLPEIASIKDLQRMISKNEALPASVLYCVGAIEE
jgi:myo-inositol-1-phosphate synthase